MRRAVFFLMVVVLFLGCMSQESPEGLGPEKPELVVVLTFDYEDLTLGRGTKNLPAILGLLENHDAPATFFVLGATAERYPEAVKGISETGHSLGLHTYYHNLPLFNEDDAAIIGGIYNVSPEVEWEKSFKTPDAFYEDILRNQEVIGGVADTTPALFRCPSLVINWTMDLQYFDTLEKTGIILDSCILQDWEDPKAFYEISGITEVPVVASDMSLDNETIFFNLAERCATVKVPLVLYLHPQHLDQNRTETLNKFLSRLEGRYRVTYLKVEEVPDYFG